MQFPEAWYVNVSRNHFSCDMGEYFEEMAPNSVLTHLDLSDNLLYGNIGMMGNGDLYGSLPDEKLPALTSLKIARNGISDVIPVLPAHIKTLDLKGQNVMSDETYSFSDFIDTNPLNMPYFFPSILTYRHSNYRDHGNTLFLLSAPSADEPWAVRLDKHDTSTSSSIFSYSASGWNVLPSGSTVYLSTLDNNEADRIRIPMVFDYPMGDINYNYDIDIGDLQTLINFAVNPESYPHYSPFNWTAANTIASSGGAPEVINVQDVVGEVNLLLEQDYNPSLARRNKAYEVQETSEASRATIAIEGSELVLESEQPVAALDLTIDGSSVAWSSNLGLFARKSRGSRTIIYSLMGSVLPAGRTVLGTVGDHALVSAAQLANAEGTLIATTIAANGETTGIVTMENGQQRTGNTIFDLQGRKVTGRQWYGSQTAKGVYIISGKKVVK